MAFFIRRDELPIVEIRHPHNYLYSVVKSLLKSGGLVQEMT